MSLSRRALIASTVQPAAGLLAGCLGDGEQQDDGRDGEEQADDDPAGTSPTVAVRDHRDLGEILVDADGLTLYAFETDERGAGESRCTGDCADSWPPLTVAEGEPRAGSAVTADLSTLEREDGSTQVAANGWPLYYFQSDEEPGDAAGQTASDVWWVLRPDGTMYRGEESGDDVGGY